VDDGIRTHNLKRAAQLLRITWDEAWGVMQRAVLRGRQAKGRSTLVCDLADGTVEYVGEERTEESLAAYFAAFTPAERAGVEAICMDMCPAYINAAQAAVAGAQDKIVFDRFHVMQHVLRALDLVRRRESKTLRSEGDERLLRTKYLWLRSVENLTEEAAERFRDLRDATLKTARAWALKENLRVLWDFPRRWQAATFLHLAPWGGIATQQVRFSGPALSPHSL
jgi:transposase